MSGDCLNKYCLVFVGAAITIAVVSVILLILYGVRSGFRSNFADNPNPLYTGPGGQLNNITGSCRSDVTGDTGKWGGCGAAEPFAANKLKYKSSSFDAHPVRAAITAKLAAARAAAGTSNFLNERSSGPEMWTANGELANFYNTELTQTSSDSQDSGATAVDASMAAAQAAAQAAAAVTSGAIAPSQASSFAANQAMKHMSSQDVLRKSLFSSARTGAMHQADHELAKIAMGVGN